MMKQEGLLYGTYRPTAYTTKETQNELLEQAMMATDAYTQMTKQKVSASFSALLVLSTKGHDISPLL